MFKKPPWKSLAIATSTILFSTFSIVPATASPQDIDDVLGDLVSKSASVENLRNDQAGYTLSNEKSLVKQHCKP